MHLEIVSKLLGRDKDHIEQLQHSRVPSLGIMEDFTEVDCSMDPSSMARGSWGLKGHQHPRGHPWTLSPTL